VKRLSSTFLLRLDAGEVLDLEVGRLLSGLGVSGTEQIDEVPLLVVGTTHLIDALAEVLCSDFGLEDLRANGCTRTILEQYHGDVATGSIPSSELHCLNSNR